MAMSLLLLSALAAPASAQDDPAIDVPVLERWCVANAPDTASLEACRDAARALLAARGGALPPRDDMLGDLIDEAGRVIDETLAEVDLSGIEETIDEAGLVIDETLAQVDPAGTVGEAGRLLDEAVADIDLEGARGALDEAVTLARAVEVWVRENPDVMCDLGATGVGYVTRAGVIAVTGDLYLSQVAYEAARDALGQACPEGDD
jgi:hypothetical protein